MRCHPNFVGFEAPSNAELGPYRLHILGPADTEEDFDAVIESAIRLSGFMGGDWPNGLTLEENRIDLCWHLREFQNNRSFAWIVRDTAGAYLGCAYVFPDFGGDGAQVSVWMRSSCDPVRHEQAFSALLMEWLEGPSWPLMDYRLALPAP